MKSRAAIILIAWVAAAGCAPKPSAPTTAPPPVVANPTPPSDTPGQTPSVAPKIINPYPGVTVHRLASGGSFVEIAGRVCLDEGYLEQVACAPNSREHESLVVITPAKPSQVHAALLLAGFTPGSPGKWTFENGVLGTVDPTGDSIEVLVRNTDANGQVVERPIRQWIRGVPVHHGEDHTPIRPTLPNLPWKFGGSAIAPNPKFMGPGEHYVADMTGSVIGLVTFGDEPLGFAHVTSDQEDVQSPEWEVNTEAIPPLDTPVTLILRAWRDGT